MKEKIDQKKTKKIKEEPHEKALQLQIELEEEIAQGIYTNLALVAHNKTEFVMDFIFVQPQQPKAKVRARIISSPVHTKRFVQALSENIERYEQLFGTIQEMTYGLEESQFKLH